MPKVGDPVWIFDANRRVYPKDEKGHSCGGPIWREHWRKDVIHGETRVSWLTGYERNPKKISKKSPGGGVAFSEEEIDRHAWVKDNGWRIGERVRYLHDYDTLKAIAELIGYKEPS